MFLITTTGTIDTVVFDDLGERKFTHPTVSYDLQTEYDIYELTESYDIQSAIDSGYITVSDGYINITTLSNFFMQTGIYDTDGNNLIDNSEGLEGLDGSYYIDAANLSGTLPQSVIGNSPLVESINGLTGSVTLIGATGISINSTNGEISTNINDSATSSTTELWSANKIQNTFNGFNPVNLFDGYDNVGGIDLTTGWTDIPLSAQRQADSTYSHTPGDSEVIITEVGQYIIFARVTAMGGNNRTQGEVRLILDTGSGYNEVPGTLGNSYHRNSTQNKCTAVSFAILTLNVGDKIKMQGRRESGSVSHVTSRDGSSLVIMNHKALKGDKGDTGSGSNIILAKEGLTVGTLTDKVNFVGKGYTVTDGGNNKTDVNINTSNDIAMVTTNSPTVMTSTTYKDIPNLTYTTKNLGGPGTYLINVSISRSHSNSGVITNFAIVVNGNIVAESETATYFNETHMVPMTAVVSGVTSGSVIKIQSKTASGSHNILNRTMSVDGVIDGRIAI